MNKETKYKLKSFGPITKRRDYSKTKFKLPATDFISVQKESFKWFLEEGLEATFNSVYPIESTNGRIKINYLPGTIRLDIPESEFEEIKKAKKKNMTYNVKIYARLRLIDVETAEVREDEVLFGDIPLMTKGGTFVINGSEKVIVSQLLRSPGPYYSLNARKTSKAGSFFTTLELIPKLGIWLDVHHRNVQGNANKDFTKIAIDKNKAVSLSIFLRAIGIKKESITELFGNSENLKNALAKDNKQNGDEAIVYMHGILRKGDRITNDSKKNLFSNILFNHRRYNLSKTGRYATNMKLNFVERIQNTILAKNIQTSSGEVLFKKGTKITFEVSKDIQKAFDNKIVPLVRIPDLTEEVYGKELEFNPELSNRVFIGEVFVNKNLTDYDEGVEPIRVISTDPNATEQHVIMPDIIAAISYFYNLIEGLGNEDDPDSLINKRVMTIGELLQNQFQISLTKMERNAKERMSSLDPAKVNPKNITNNKSVLNQFKTFFNTSQLSQFMDQINPLAEIANKRRVTSLGPGGLNRETAKFEVRDVHTTHYGRICPIETPEGPNIGLILNFANYAVVNELGYIETPYFKVVDGKVVDKPVYLTTFQEHGYTFAQSLVALDSENRIIDKEVTVRKNSEYVVVKSSEVDYVDVSSRQMTSISSSCIPFLENDDANRALMGANMQRQSVPLLKAEAPYVATGIESEIAKYSATNIISGVAGTVNFVDSEHIQIEDKDGKNVKYRMRSFERSNQGSLVGQKPIVKVGQKIKEGDLLTDGSSFDNGELALGKNVVVAFTTWNGYNYEDAIIVSERLVKDDVFTSIHIEEQSVQFRKAKAGDDMLTSDLPNVSNFAKRHLDEEGIVIIGSEVEAGDILVGRTSPKGEDNPTPEEKLISTIFSRRSKSQRDSSLKVKHGHGGTIIDVQELSRENGDKLQDGVDKIIKVFIAQKRKIKVGDKMAGRHGNKGVISRVLPIEDMPHLADGTPVDIMLNPQGVPSRMNIGQVLEMHLGMAAKKLGVKFVTHVFDGIKSDDIQEALVEADYPKDGKFDLFDPTSGTKFDARISVGVMYMLKLSHMIDDKMHARSVGPYSLITQQPLGGKSQNGGQRFGEMETWAIESYGASNILQELLTYKSDNIDGRNKIYNALASGTELPEPGTPESFNVLKYELLGLGMKLDVFDNKKGSDK